MTVNEMRTFIIQHPKYKNSMYWKEKVLRMPDNQVIAIYNKFRQKSYEQIEKDLTVADNNQYHQMDIFEYVAEKEANKNE